MFSRGHRRCLPDPKQQVDHMMSENGIRQKALAVIIFSMILSVCVVAAYGKIDALAATFDGLDVSAAAPSQESDENATAASAESNVTDNTDNVSDAKYAVCLGADLNDNERTEVLKMLGFGADSPDQDSVCTVTNEDEHKYLDAYLDPERIGTRSLTSVKLVLEKQGSGITVHTDNIDYCTEGMYRNALMTAGVEDVSVIVSSPCKSSGTAGIIGALRAYEKASGNKISDQAIDTAVAEMTATGQIEDEQTEVQEKADAEAMIVWLKTQMADGNADTDNGKSIDELINNAVQRFDIQIGDEDRDGIKDLLTKWNSLGLNTEYIKQQSENLYKQYGEDVLEKANQEIEGKVRESAGEFFNDLMDSLRKSFSNFFKNLVK